MKVIIRILSAAVLFLTAVIPVFQSHGAQWLWLLLPCFFLLNVFPSYVNRRLPDRRLRLCADGCELLILFLISAVLSGLYLLTRIPALWPEHAPRWFAGLIWAILAEAVVFWNGIIRVYGTSLQIGFKWRMAGIICGWIPGANLIVLCKIIRIASEETAFESGKILLNREREQEQLCKTRYPLLMVHGVFFRDFKYFNYWGRVPKELERNGAVIFYIIGKSLLK